VANKSNLGQKCPWKTKTIIVGILGQMTKTNQNFHRWYPWTNMTNKKQKHSSLVSLSEKAKKQKISLLVTLVKYGQEKQELLPLITLAKNRQGYFFKNGWKLHGVSVRVTYQQYSKLTFQTMNIAQMFLNVSTCCLCAQEIRQQKNEKTSCEKSPPLRPLVLLLSQETF